MEYPVYLSENTLNDNFLNIFIQKNYLDGDFHIHRHDFTEMLIVLEGTAQHIVDNTSYMLRPGDICVIKPSVSHGFSNARHFRHCNIMFNSNTVFENCRSLYKLPGFQILFSIETNIAKEESYKSMICLDASDTVFVDKLTDRMIKETAEKNPGYEAVAHALFVELAVFCSRKYKCDSNRCNENITNLARTVIYMEENFREDISLDDLASVSCLSPRHFSRIFRNIYKISPFSYIFSLRIEYACNLLKYTDLSVTEISALSGFKDSNYFARAFKKYKAISPTTYRKSINSSNVISKA